MLRVPALWNRPTNAGLSRRDPLDSIRREMDRVFDDFWSDFGAPSLANGGRLRTLMAPRVDVSETDTEVRVTAELPGLDKKDVDVTVSDGMLSITGEKKAESEDEGSSYHVRERTYGHFERSMPIGTEIEEDKVKATFKNGVLTVTLPKTEAAQKRFKRIPVEA